jgi:GNAT superfamily N-acetyltransferase
VIVGRADWPALREKLEALFLQSFGKSIEPGYFDWRYFNNGQEQFLFSIETADQLPIASYSAFPVELISNDEKFRTAMSMTTMTHPNSRGKGLFQKLASELYAHAERLQIAAVWGFPNANSHLTFNSKLFWSDIYEIPTMTLDVSKIDARKFALDSGIRRDNEFSSDYSQLPTDGLIRVHRSQAYLSWRYARNPANAYDNHVIARHGTVSSYVVSKMFGDGVDLVDIQTLNPEEARALLVHIVRVCYERNLRCIYCWAPSHHFVHGVLERLGFANLAPVTYFGGRDLKSPGMPSGWKNYRKWYIQMGDSDVY